MQKHTSKLCAAVFWHPPTPQSRHARTSARLVRGTFDRSVYSGVLRKSCVDSTSKAADRYILVRSANSVLRNASPSSFRNLTFTRWHAKYHRKARCIPGGTSSAFPHVPARARSDGRENLLEQAPSLATHMVRSRRDLAKPYLQVVHSGVLASSDSPVTPRWNKCQTCAWHF